jgi:hypothetical protein
MKTWGIFRMNRRFIPFVLVASIACFSPLLHAQTGRGGGEASRPKRTAIRDELPPDARRSWNAALELYEAKDYRGARVEFMRAYELSRNPRVLFNVGVCDKNLARYARAVAIWRQQLQEGAVTLSVEEADATRAAIAAAEQFVSTVQVTANVDGATLLVDDESSGQTPLAQPVPIDVGRHVLKLRKDGYQEQSVEVTISGGKPEQVSFKLEPLVRTTVVTVTVPSVPGATVFMDGTDMGPAPFKGEVPVGRHTFEARAPGFVTARQTSDVVYQQPLDVTLSLARERHEGKVRIHVDEPDAVILVDGKVVGSGRWEGVLPSGGHQLTVRKTGFVTYTTDLALTDGQVRDVSVPMRKEEKGAAWVWWTAGTLAVVAGGAVAGYFVFKPTKEAPVTGTWAPGLLPAGLR